MLVLVRYYTLLIINTAHIYNCWTVGGEPWIARYQENQKQSGGTSLHKCRHDSIPEKEEFVQLDLVCIIQKPNFQAILRG